MKDQISQSNTAAFNAMAWLGFILSTAGMLIGIVYLPTTIWIKGYLGIGYLFTVTSCLTLAKALRDKDEAIRLYNRLRDAKAEKLLNDYEKVSELN